ncbi:MAG: 50S ribosomal protein L15 [candidate division Zixibacteria bacterium]|nr:50S ribosomal protein L15 [candidate division Zixibacteria bacterium]
MDLHNLKPAAGSKKTRKRVGRGPGSGLGKTSGRGHKGQGSRSGGGNRPAGFEGGQMPLYRQLPKFGFFNKFKKEYQIVNLVDLARVEAGEVSPETLQEAGLIRNASQPVKILGNGNVEKAYSVKAAAFSKSAAAKIEAAGGKAEVVK